MVPPSTKASNRLAHLAHRFPLLVYTELGLNRFFEPVADLGKGPASSATANALFLVWWAYREALEVWLVLLCGDSSQDNYRV
jgi:hypothetical protein